MKMLIRLNFCSVSKIEGGGGAAVCSNYQYCAEHQKWAANSEMSLKTAAFFVHSEEPVLIFLVERHEIAFETFDESNTI